MRSVNAFLKPYSNIMLLYGFIVCVLLLYIKLYNIVCLYAIVTL